MNMTWKRKIHRLAFGLFPIAVGVALTAGILWVNSSQAILQEPNQIEQVSEPTTVLSDTLSVGVNLPYWPFEYYSGTQIVGHDITLMNAVAAQLGVPVEYIAVPWESIFYGLKNGDYDAVISALTVTPERESIIDFSLPYLSYYSPGGNGDLAIAVHEGNILRTQINEALLRLRANGTLETIINDVNVDISGAYSDTWVTLPEWPEVPTDTETTLTYSGTQGTATIINIPTGAVSETIILTYSPLATDVISSSFSIAGFIFDLDAYAEGSILPPGYQFNVPITITIQYTNTDVTGLDEDSLQLLYWNKETENWIEATCGSYERHPESNWLALPICHLSRFALTGENYSIHLPVIMAND